MSNLIKSTFISFVPDEKKIIKIDNNNPRIINSNNLEKNEENSNLEMLDSINEEKTKVLNEAKNKAVEIIEQAEKKIELMKEEELKISREKGYSKGFEEGYKKGKEEASKLRIEVENEKEKNILEYEKMLSELEPKFAELVIKLTEKLTGIIVEEKEELIINLINRGIHNVDASNELVINISEEDEEFVFNNKDNIEGINKPNIKVDIVASSKLQKGQCVIETNNGNINSSIDEMLSELKGDIKLLSHF